MAILGVNGFPSRLWILPVAVIVVIHCIKKLCTKTSPNQDQDQKPSDEKKTDANHEGVPVKGRPNTGESGKTN